MKMTKKEALEKINELKKYIDEPIEETKTVGIAIKSIFGSIIFQSTKTTLVEAIHEANLSGVDLCGADLIRANLSGANLSGVNLSEVDLCGADLHGANLRGTDLSRANLSGVNLQWANLYEADLYGADLYGANLYEAELQNVKFYGRGGTKPLNRSQLPYFLAALGFIIED